MFWMLNKERISIHPPREGWDIGLGIQRGRSSISIHPPREGWDSPALFDYWW